MSLLTDTGFLHRIQGRLPLFRQTGQNLYNFRCPLCGDSESKPNVKRGYLYKNGDKDALSFKCHRCNEAMGFHTLLKRLDLEVYKEYNLESMKEYRGQQPNRQPKKPKPKLEITYKGNNKLSQFKKPDKYLSNLTSIKDLGSEHTAYQYLQSRLISEAWFTELYYTDDFVSYINAIIPGKLKTHFEDKRIIIPLRDTDGSVFGVQGRSINPDIEKRFRFFTIIFDTEIGHKVFGLDRLDTENPIVVVEGPFDSLFINNAIAVCGSSMSAVAEALEQFDTKKIYVLDNEPRNKNIVKMMKGLLDKGNSIVIIDDPAYYGKDINDMIKDGMTKDTVYELLMSNSFSGIRGLLKLNHWSRT